MSQTQTIDTKTRTTSDRDAKSYIILSGLPPAMVEMMLTVVGKLRLRNGEKYDVACELVEHFHDGIDAGIAPDELMKLFGDTAQIATLIRRSKKRQRSIYWWSMVRTLQAFGCIILLFIICYIGAIFYYHSGSPVISHDYLADVTAKSRSVAEADRAWPLYREALIVLKPAYHELTVGNAIYAKKPGDEGWDETVDFLSTHAESLALVREGGSKPGLGFVVGYTTGAENSALWSMGENEESEPVSLVDGSLIGLLLPFLAEHRTLVKLLSCDVYYAIEQGDSERAAANINAMFGLAKHSRETPTLIGDLVAAAIAAVAFETLGEALQDHPEAFSDPHLHTLAHELSSLTHDRSDNILLVRLGCEEIYMLDVIQRIYTDDGDGNGHLSPDGFSALTAFTDGTVPPESPSSYIFFPAVAAAMADRKELVAEYSRLLDKMIADSMKPLWERATAEECVDAEIERLASDWRWRTKYHMIYLLMPALERASTKSELMVQERDAVMTAVTLELYRRDHNGNYPETLNALVPEYLPSIPADRFVGTDLGYAVSPDYQHITLYCVGADMDDDGGRRPANESKNRTKASQWERRHNNGDDHADDPDGDWILWESEATDEQENIG